MDIGCPNCAATYRVPDAWLASGNPLRCAACGHAWLPIPPESEPIAESPIGENPAGGNPDGESPGEESPIGENPDGENPDGESLVFSPPEPLSVVVVPSPAPEPLPLVPEPAAPPPPPVRGQTPANAAPPPLQRRGPPHHPIPRAAAPLAAPARGSNILAIVWLASVLVVVIVLLGLVLYHAELAGLWPPFARVAGLIGH